MGNDNNTKDKGFKESLMDAIGSDGGNLAAVLDSIVRSYTDIAIEFRKSNVEMVKEYVNAHKEILEEKPTRAYDVEEKKLDLEHQREMLRIQIEVAQMIASSKIEKMKLTHAHRKEMYNHYVDVLAGFWGFKTKTKKLLADMLAKNAARDFIGKLNGGPEGNTPLPAPAPSLSGKKSIQNLLLEILNDAKK